ncbi:hypothetical protein AB0912_10255 [Streptomyces sp. NPDC007084]|uniref:hypothetical protein n=1 Tax=Streptomyces sp. NPDC007084 TaxID=3154313 RepID=UPI0034548A7A
MRGSYINNYSGDNVNSTTYGAWTYLYLSNRRTDGLTSGPRLADNPRAGGRPQSAPERSRRW